MKKNTLLLTLTIAVLSIILSGCGGGATLTKADAEKKKMNWKMAGDIYTQAAPNIKDKEGSQRARTEAGFCYRMANEFDK